MYILRFLLLLLACGALYGGGALIWKPDGSLLRMETWLEKNPFDSFLLPGLILFVLMGILPLIAVAGLWFQPKWDWPERVNLFREQPWAWTFSLYSGVITIAWIIVQQLLVGYFILQPVVALVGLLILVFTLMPRVMKACKKF